MELVNIVTARSVWLFDTAQLNPRGKAIFPELFGWLKDAYDFQKVPTSITDLDDTKGLAFTGGQYQVKEEIFVTVELKIYNDGLIANTQSSTRDSDRFLEDVLISGSNEFNINYRQQMVHRKLHLSELNVLSTKKFVHPGLEAFAEKVSKATESDKRVDFEFAGVSFWPRQTFPPLVISSFGIERKVNTDRDQNTCFSRAPIHTDDHLALLNEFENELMA
jgi:hypothetical protein